MKQIYIILAIVIIATIVTAINVFKPGPGTETAALIINDKVITQTQLNQRLAQKTHDLSPEGYLSALINRELLIQEAQKLKLDQEESFRQSLQDFYEQSLIETLIRRNKTSQQVSISDAQTNRYLALMGKELILNKMQANSLKAARAQQFSDQEQISINFSELSDIPQYHLTTTPAGDLTPPFEIDGRWIRMKLLEAKGDSLPSLSETARTQIKKNLTNSAQTIAQTQWIQSLRQNANIEILIKTPQPDPKTNVDGS